MDETTLNITCDVIEPSDGKGYERDPRSLAKRAEAYLKSTGLGDTAYFGPEPEFFIFDAVEWSVDMSGSYCKVFSSEAAWSIGREIRRRQHGPPARRSRAAISRSRRSIRCRTSGPRCASRWSRWASRSRCITTKSPNAGQCEIGTKFETLVKRADWLQILKYAVHNTAHAYGKTATFMPKPIVGDNGSGMHCPPVGLEGRQEPVRRRRLLGPVGLRAVLHRRRDQAREGAERDHQSGHELVQAAGAGLRGADQPRVLGAQPLGGDPHSVRRESEGPPDRGALPDPTANPYLAFAAMLMAGLDGVQNKIHPGDPMDKNLYDLEPEEAAKVPHPCASLDEALDHLDRDRAFLTKGGVFTDDMIDAYIALKMEEVTRFRMTTHPVEYEMYFSL